MYRGFNLKCAPNAFDKAKVLSEWGQQIYEANQKDVLPKLEHFIQNNGKIDASQMQEEWFPQVKSDVFISHSHHDKDQAIILAGLLSKLGLNIFIDSSIWLNSKDLLWDLDNKYCRNADQATFNYNKRNFSTSHVHMILSNALSRMIYTSECVLFLNTPNSVSVSDQIKKTSSPWIYAEITTTSIIKKRSREEHRKDIKKAVDSRVLTESFDFEYNIDLNHLTELDENDLLLWLSELIDKKYDFPLDALYKIKS